MDVGSFDRVRISGDVDVRVATGRSPAATLSGPAAALAQVDVRVNGTVLTVTRHGLPAARDRPPVVVTLATPALVAASLAGAGSLRIDAMTGAQADLSVAGSGAIAVGSVAAGQVSAATVGEGRITLAGHARALRLSTVGTGTIDAAKLVADDLTVRLNGAGETLAQARYVATIFSAGTGRVAVSGKPKCTVHAPAGSAVTCGAP